MTDRWMSETHIIQFPHIIATLPILDDVLQIIKDELMTDVDSFKSNMPVQKWIKIRKIGVGIYQTLISEILLMVNETTNLG